MNILAFYACLTGADANLWGIELKPLRSFQHNAGGWAGKNQHGNRSNRDPLHGASTIPLNATSTLFAMSVLLSPAHNLLYKRVIKTMTRWQHLWVHREMRPPTILQSTCIVKTASIFSFSKAICNSIVPHRFKTLIFIAESSWRRITEPAKPSYVAIIHMAHFLTHSPCDVKYIPRHLQKMATPLLLATLAHNSQLL